jgi:hypothetical protein
MVERYSEDFLTISCNLDEYYVFHKKISCYAIKKVNKKIKKKYDCVTVDYKKKYLEMFAKSKLNPSLFCRLHKINYRNFKNWLKIVST